MDFWAREGKVWGGDQEKYGKQTLFSCVGLKSMPSPLVRVIEPLIPGRISGDIFYKCKLPSQKENLCPVFRAFPLLASFQRPLAKNNSYVKVAYLGVAYSGTLQNHNKNDASSLTKIFGCFCVMLTRK